MDTEVVNPLPSLFVEQSHPPSSKGWILNKERLTIGRDASSDVCVADPHASEHHADFVRRGSSWAIIDAGSTNGTYVNGARIHEVILRADDRIGIGTTELVLRVPSGANVGTNPGPPPIRYDVGSQVGTVSNVAGNQSNYMTESTLRYIASRRGRARVLIVWGIVLFILGQALAVAAVLGFQGGIIDAIRSRTFGQEIPVWYLPAVGIGAFMTLIGFGMFVFGLIARSGAKREARRLGAEWP